ncbi:zf-CCHC domain-containing protein [Tanacetum coccineum]
MTRYSRMWALRMMEMLVIPLRMRQRPWKRLIVMLRMSYDETAQFMAGGCANDASLLEDEDYDMYDSYENEVFGLTKEQLALCETFDINLQGFETYVKSKDIVLWHIIVYADYKPIVRNTETDKEEIILYEKLKEDNKKLLSKNDEAKMVLYNALPKKEYERIFMCKTAKDIWNSLIITHQCNEQVKDNKIDLFVQKYEEFIISDDETIDCAFSRFNTIITSLKSLDESFLSRNHVRKFLRALPSKWRLKVMAIEESKDFSTLPLDELIGNLIVYKGVLEKDSKASKNKKEKYKSLALKAKKVSSDEEVSCSDSDDEEYAMANFRRAKEEKKGKEERRCFKCGVPNHFISDCPKHSFNNQKAFVGGCWSDSNEEDDSKKDKICLMAHDTNEKNKEISVDYESCIDLHSKIDSLSLKLAKFENRSHFLQEMIENQRLQKDKKGLEFTEDRASTSEVKTGKLGQENGKKPSVELSVPVPSARELASAEVGNRAPTENYETLDLNLIKRTNFVQITKKNLPSTTVVYTKQSLRLKLEKGPRKSKIQTPPS